MSGFDGNLLIRAYEDLKSKPLPFCLREFDVDNDTNDDIDVTERCKRKEKMQLKAIPWNSNKFKGE